MIERSVISLLFPHVQLVICLFYSLRTFNREITCEKLGITLKQRKICKKYFEELCYAKNEIQYQNVFVNLKNQVPQQVLNYFLKNWHNIRSQWVRCLVFNCGNFFNTINNRLESFNAKLKSVIPIFSNIQEFFPRTGFIII